MYGSKMKSEETDHLFEAILSLKDLEECEPIIKQKFTQKRKKG